MMSAARKRPLRIEGDVAYVPLAGGGEAVIDATDAALVGARNWHSRPTTRDGLVHVRCCIYESGVRSKRYLHRMLMNPPPGFEVDHVDGDGLNNRRANLRVATRTENQWNRRSLINPLGKGVYERENGSFMSRIRANDRVYHLGSYQTAREARAAYEGASRVLHGEYALVGRSALEDKP